ncbi:EpsG family protein [Vibrio vulnificus]
MMIYSFILFLILFFFAVAFFCDTKTTQRITVFLLFIISIFIGFRDVNIGTDTENYINFFNEIPNDVNESFFFSNGSPLFQGLIFLSHALGLTASGALFVCSVIINVILLCASARIKKVGPYFLLVFLTSFSYFLLSLNILRQGLAVVSFLLFVLMNTKRNNTSSYMWMVVSILFHPSSIIAIFIYFLSFRLSMSLSKAVSFILVGLVISIFDIDVVSSMLSVIKLINVMPNITYRLEYYLTDYDVKGSVVGVGYFVTCAIGFVCLIYEKRLNLFSREFLDNEKLAKVSISLVFVNVILYPIWAPYAAISRLSFYFYPFEMLLFCILVFSSFKDKGLRVFIFVITTLLLYSKSILAGIAFGFL